MLVSWVFDPVKKTVTTEWSAKVTGVDQPDRFRIALGPSPGQLTLWHYAGVVVMEPLQLAPPPAAPTPTPASGEMFALILAVSAATCNTGASSNFSLIPAVLLPGRAPHYAPQWKLGPTFGGANLSAAQCNRAGLPAVDPDGRRAWVQFACWDATGVDVYVAQLALGAPGDAPRVSTYCAWRFKRRQVRPIARQFALPYAVARVRPNARARAWRCAFACAGIGVSECAAARGCRRCSSTRAS